MLPVLLAAFHAGVAASGGGGVATTIGGPLAVQTANSGTCSSSAFDATLLTPASLRLTWTIAHADDAHYALHIVEDGVTVDTLASSAAAWTKTIAGNVEHGAFNTWVSNWSYRVDLVRLSDSLVVGSVTAASPWSMAYGTCSSNAS